MIVEPNPMTITLLSAIRSRSRLERLAPMVQPTTKKSTDQAVVAPPAPRAPRTYSVKKLWTAMPPTMRNVTDQPKRPNGASRR